MRYPELLELATLADREKLYSTATHLYEKALDSTIDLNDQKLLREKIASIKALQLGLPMEPIIRGTPDVTPATK